MPTLLQFNVYANCASTGRLAEDLGDVALKAGWKSYIAFGREFRPSHSELIRVGTKLDVYAHVLKTRLFDRHGFGSERATKKLIKQIDDIKPDVIQFQNVHGYFLNLPVILSYIAEKNIPLIWSLHDCWSMTGHCAHFALNGCEKWKEECNHCPLLKDYPNSWGWDSSKRNHREKKKLIEAIPRLTIVSGSEWLANIAKQSYFKNRDIRVIPDGIDTEIYSPKSGVDELRKQHRLENKFVILASGTVWPPYKGLADYAKLRHVLSNEYAIVIVGMQPKEIRSLPKGLIGIPRTKTPEELARWYSAADCVMSLSRLESFGLTPVEGFACGSPAIVYNCTSTPELITPETGFVAEVGNIDDVKAKVEKMREIGKSSYAKRCREIALEKYDRNVCFNQYLSLYEDLIKI